MDNITEIDTSGSTNVEWYQTGEKISNTNMNRPIKDIAEKVNELIENNNAFESEVQSIVESYDYMGQVEDFMYDIRSEIPELSIPFMNSGKLDYGIGTEYVTGLPIYSVNFERASDVSVINKSGILETLSDDVIGIGSGGVWLHGEYTNEHPYGNNLYNWTGGTDRLESDSEYAGATMFLVTDDDNTSNQSVRYEFSSSLATDTNYHLQFLVKNVDASASKITLQGDMADTLDVTITWDGNDISSISGAVSYRKISDDVYLVVSESSATSSSLGTVNNYVFPASFVTDGSTTGSIYIGAMMVIESDSPKELPFILTDGESGTASATSCTVPVSNNLPIPGESFTIICDTAIPNIKSVVFGISNESFVLWRFQEDGTVNFRVSDGTTIKSSTLSTTIDGSEQRYVIVYDAETTTVYTYADGIGVDSVDFSDVDWSSTPLGTGTNIRIGGSVQSTYLDSHLKNFKVLHYAASADEVKYWGAPK